MTKMFDDAVTAFRNGEYVKTYASPEEVEVYRKAYIDACTNGPVDICCGLTETEQHAYEDAYVDNDWRVPSFED